MERQRPKSRAAGKGRGAVELRITPGPGIQPIFFPNYYPILAHIIVCMIKASASLLSLSLALIFQIREIRGLGIRKEKWLL